MANNNVDNVSQIWFIHGANASPTSFNYIKDVLKEDPAYHDIQFVDVVYDAGEKLASNVKTITSNLPARTTISLVGHSLGGVIATAVSQRAFIGSGSCNINRIVTMSSPLGGSESADYLKWLYPNYSLFSNISTKNKTIQDMNKIGAIVPTLSLVTTSGNNPLYPTANDGVVTVKSQRALDGVDYIEVPFNHFEVLLSPDVAEHIRIFLSPTTVIS